MASDDERNRAHREAMRLLRHPIAAHIRHDAARRRGGETDVGEGLHLTPAARDHYMQAVTSLVDGRPLQPEAVARIVDALPDGWRSPEEQRISQLMASREGRETLALMIRGSHSGYQHQPAH